MLVAVSFQPDWASKEDYHGGLTDLKPWVNQDSAREYGVRSTVYVSCRLLLVEVTLHMCDSLAGFIAACTMLLITWCHMLNQLDQHVSCFGCPPSLCATNRYSCSILPGINIRVSSACQSEDAQDIFMQLGEFRILLVVISCQTCSPCQVTISQLGG